MTESPTLTLRIVNGQSLLDSIPVERPLTKKQELFIRQLVAHAVEECIARRDKLRSHPERMLRLPDVITQTSLSRSSIYKLVNAGIFPAPLKLGSSVRWKESEVTNWLDTQPRNREI